MPATKIPMTSKVKSTFIVNPLRYLVSICKGTPSVARSDSVLGLGKFPGAFSLGQKYSQKSRTLSEKRKLN
uniref:Uncharacterized protein n=1 Tax=Vespula pensylvanica TaxID=30213 RepID=A0A834PAY8_VESPE|nr:hypothetical protein H0235_002948 [Vespula pensylvanica]